MLLFSGRQGNGVGMKIIGGKAMPNSTEVGAYVATIYKGGVADQLHGEVNEGTLNNNIYKLNFESLHAFN